MKIDLDFLLPEIYVIFWLTLFVIQYSILSRRKFFVMIGEKLRVFVINPIPSITSLLLVLSIYYLALQLYGGYKYKLYISISGIYSTPTIYYVKLILAVLFILYFLYLRSDQKSLTFYTYEFYIVLFFAFLFLNLMLISSSFLNIFIFIELYSLCVYYLIASKKNTSRGVEAAIKYFIFGSISSVLLIFGIFLLYYSTGSGDFLDIFNLTFLNPYYQTNIPYIIATYLICLSLIIKLGASVFFFWMVEIYDGISYHMLIFLNLFPKVVYVFILFTLLDKFNLFHLGIVVKVLIGSSLFIGLLGAITELKIKRFLVFTSIYNIAFFSLPFWYSNAVFSGTFLFFITVYLLNTFIYMTLFASLKDWSTETSPKSLLDLYHIRAQNPQLAYLFIFFTFFASGLPMSALFLVKFSMFFELAKTAHIFVLLVFILASSLSLFYYIRIVKIILQGTPLPSFLVKPIPNTIAFLAAIMIWLNFIFVIFFDKFVVLLNFYIY